METDIGRMSDARFDPVPIDDYQPPQYQQQQQVPQYDYITQSQPQTQQYQEKKSDFFADIDKKAWIFILIALILGFFMGKTMQPIILRSV